jgi:FeS assembly SUF system regulator
MLRLTNLADYAVVIMLHAARAGDGRLSASAVAAETGIPAPTAAKIMNMLARAGLLASHRGVSGGFELQRPAGTISVAAIIEAVEGPIAMTQCAETDHSDCAMEDACAMRPHWDAINRVVRLALDSVTLADLSTPFPSLAALMPSKSLAAE